MSDNKSQTERKLGLLVFSTCFTILLAEFVLGPVACRARMGLSRGMVLMGFAARPGQDVDGTIINAQGYTGDAFKKRRYDGLRILTFGGSAMFNRDMTDRLRKAIASRYAGELEVQGAALRSHTSRSSLIKFRKHFSRYELDYVIVYHGINDLFADQCPPDKFRDDYSQINAWYRRSWLLDNSIVARFFYNRIIHRQQNRFSQRKHKEAGEFRSIPPFESNMRELVRSLKAQGATPILMTFAWHIPDDYTRKKFLSHELDYVNRIHYNECAVDLWGTVDYVKEALARNNAAIRQIAREERVLLIDQDSRFSHRPTLFGDVCHYNEPGSDQFVNSIAEFLEQEGAF